MGKVYLLNNQRDSLVIGITPELTEEMFRWPIYFEDGKIHQNWEEVYKKALKALLELGLFDSTFSMKVYMNKKVLAPANSCWGEILLNNNFVVGFRHDTKGQNHLFETVFDWPELEDPRRLYEWSIEEWRTFFINRIKDETQKNLMTAKCDLASAELEMKKANDRLMERQKQTEAITLAMKNIERGCV